MRNSLLTKRQKEVLRYRKSGMTQQEIANILQTSKANICMIEKHARRKIQCAQDTLTALYTLDATLLCTLPKGSDLFDAVTVVSEAAGTAGIPVPEDPLDLVNWIRAGNPDRIHGRHIREDIRIYTHPDGELFF